MNWPNEFESLAQDVLLLSRNTLLVNLRFMDMALNQFTLISEQMPFATDGQHLYYDARYILLRYREEKEQVTRDYLHTVLHCVFRHMYVHVSMNQTLWNLACDIAVEDVSNSLGLNCTFSKRQEQQTTVLDMLRKDIRLLTAEKIYRWYLDHPPQEPDTIQELFRGDIHTPWYLPLQTVTDSSSADVDTPKDDFSSHRNSETRSSESGVDDSSSDGVNKSKAGESTDIENGKNESDDFSNNNDSEVEADDSSDDSDAKSSELSNDEGSEDIDSISAVSISMEQIWKDIAQRMQVDLETFSRSQENQAGALIQNLKSVNREKYDYTAFLKKFAVRGEVMRLNPDEFDYVYYTYGLKLYDNMPLIEPLEYRETKRIREFVVAIDTSGSVSGELVQAFIQKTYNVLKSTESFFSKINLHIIQCDAEIQEDAKITSQKEFDAYLKTMTVKGLGGTDFRPVFAYVDKLRQTHEFQNLKGLIYFTDGYGEFPAKKPDYDTAFILLEDEYNDPNVPPWAIKLILQKNEL